MKVTEACNRNPKPHTPKPQNPEPRAPEDMQEALSRILSSVTQAHKAGSGSSGSTGSGPSSLRRNDCFDTEPLGDIYIYIYIYITYIYICDYYHHHLLVLRNLRSSRPHGTRSCSILTASSPARHCYPTLLRTYLQSKAIQTPKPAPEALNPQYLLPLP